MAELSSEEIAPSVCKLDSQERMKLGTAADKAGHHAKVFVVGFSCPLQASVHKKHIMIIMLKDAWLPNLNQ